ncbi:thermonuclease family protein [Pseudomonas syringae pv. actinidiae]|nr:thermonuclease family protein [Pseudomonas syringae pv. actinidiae]
MSAIWLSGAEAFCPAPASLPIAHVQRVVDGDTLRLTDGRNVRMIGLNTPETGKKGRSAEPFAEAAKKQFASTGGQKRRAGQPACRSAGQGHYGRTLANVYGRDGDNLEAQLLSEGLGYLVAVAPNVALVDCQQSAEREARQARRGVWRNSPVQPSDKLRKSGFAMVSGKVRSVQRNRGGIWIELHGSLVLRVAPDQASRFDMAALERLKGRQIETRGWVVDRSGRGWLEGRQSRWMIALSHPAMLSF